MRPALRCLGLATAFCLLIVSHTIPAGAQLLPAGIVVDSALRIDFLFGNQVFGRRMPSRAYGDIDTRSSSSYAAELNDQNVRMDLKARVPLLEGVVELSAPRMLSARFSGISSFLQGNMPASLDSHRMSGTSLYDTGNRLLLLIEKTVRPDYQSWEAAGLVHLYADGRYRFSGLGGYRQDYWKYNLLDGSVNNRLDYRHSSRIPFLGLQTAMSFPWWKATMEVLGSPFMKKLVYLYAYSQNFGTTMDIEGTWTRGGMIEVKAEGSTFVTPNFTLGIAARYSYEELWGQVSGKWDPTPTTGWPYEFFTYQNLAYIGMNIGWIF